jgi:hypothetical protein
MAVLILPFLRAIAHFTKVRYTLIQPTCDGLVLVSAIDTSPFNFVLASLLYRQKNRFVDNVVKAMD